MEAGAKKFVVTAPGKNCPTYVCGVNEGDYAPAAENVVSNASCTTNGITSVCKVLGDAFGIEYGTMTTAHFYIRDQIFDGRHPDLRRARAGAANIVPTPNVSIVGLGGGQRRLEGCLRERPHSRYLGIHRGAPGVGSVGRCCFLRPPLAADGLRPRGGPRPRPPPHTSGMTPRCEPGFGSLCPWPPVRIWPWI